MYRTTSGSRLGLTLAAMTLLACDTTSPSESQTPTESVPVEEPQEDATGAEDDAPLDCAWSDAKEATQDLISLDTEQGSEWTITDGAPDWARPEDIEMYFSEAAWDGQLQWEDGALHDFTFSLEEIVQFQHAVPVEGNDDERFVVDTIVSLEIPALGLYTTREVTLISTYSEFIWSMGGSMTAVVAEQEHCENALLIHSRYSFEGPTGLVLLAQSQESGLQAVLGIQED